MSQRRTRRPKRKAAEAALDAIAKLQRQDYMATADEQEEDDRRRKQDFFLDCSLSFRNDSIELPGELIICILEFLPKNDLVHSASLVNHAWLATTKNPLLWPALGGDIWNRKKRCSSITSMKRFLDFLRRPQFKRLKRLQSPIHIHRTQSRRTFDHISAACPLLENLDFFGCGISPFADEIPLLPLAFPNLTSARFYIRWDVDRGQIHHFLRHMGPRLRELVIPRVAFLSEATNGFTDETLSVMLKHCPNLETFRYTQPSFLHVYDDLITADGVISLLKKAPKLRCVSLALQESACDSIWNFLTSDHSDVCCIKECDLHANGDDELW
jgi:hypothetical protein